MHVQLRDYYNEILSFYNENKKNTSNLSTYLKYLKHRIQIEKLIDINNNKIETHSKNMKYLKIFSHTALNSQ